METAEVARRQLAARWAVAGVDLDPYLLIPQRHKADLLLQVARQTAAHPWGCDPAGLGEELLGQPVLLDTHVLQWWWCCPGLLSPLVRSLLKQPAQPIWVSAISLMELSAIARTAANLPLQTALTRLQLDLEDEGLPRSAGPTGAARASNQPPLVILRRAGWIPKSREGELQLERCPQTGNRSQGLHHKRALAPQRMRELQGWGCGGGGQVQLQMAPPQPVKVEAARSPVLALSHRGASKAALELLQPLQKLQCYLQVCSRRWLGRRCRAGELHHERPIHVVALIRRAANRCALQQR